VVGENCVMRIYVNCTYSSSNIISMIKEYEILGECSTHGKNAYKILVSKPEEKGHLEDLEVD
jgi:hypothetical protein